MPVTDKNPESRSGRIRKMILICALIPMLMILGGYTGSRMHETFAGVNGKVRLAKALLEPPSSTGKPELMEVTAFKSSGKPVAMVFSEASGILRQFYLGGWILGCFLGLVFGITIAYRMVTTYRTDYTPNKGSCLSCTRCVDFCPIIDHDIA
jgi:hypothetical protein